MTLRFQEIFLTEPHFVMSGAYESRVQNSQASAMAGYPCLFNLLYHQVGVDALAKWYRHDIHTAENQNIPIILSCPTLRANAHAIKLAGYKTPEGITKINADAINFVRGLRDQFLEYSEGIFLCAPIEAKNTAINATATLSLAEAEDYHAAQVQAITAAKPDILFFTALRALPEAQACAHLAAKSGMTYGLGFTVNREGQLADGLLLEDAISAIDAAVSPRPFFYVITCTHPSVIKQTLRRNSRSLQRVLGMLANATAKPLMDTTKAQRNATDEPAQFVHALMTLGEQYRLKIFGGCCGTDDRYFSMLCERIGRKNNRDRRKLEVPP